MAVKAWLLTERWRNGSDHIEGIALTNRAASAWVHELMEVGHTRTSMPYQVIDEPTQDDDRGDYHHGR